MHQYQTLEDQLNSFSPSERRSALEKLASMVASGEIVVPPVKEEVNLHFHTFFSFNAHGWSPTRIAWESLKYGLEVAGIVDFDVLDGMEEFLSAGELIGLKAIVGLESRVFVKELADKVMSSPNEPGIAYFMATGCFKYPPEGTDAARIFKSMAETARSRNTALMERVNEYLDPVTLSYEADVLPLTPSGNATERHLLTAYETKAQAVFNGDAGKIVEFWATKLNITEQQAAELMQDRPKFHELMRTKLMKFGGVGYVPPDSGSFPAVEDAIRMIRGMEALPTITWLDGTNAGEADTMGFLELLHGKGCVALNIIPDRNWNIKDPEEKALKTRKLREVVEGARELHLPISVGTEMNRLGLPFVDDFHAPELMPYVEDFLRGARCIYGHTLLARYADFGWFSEAAQKAFGDDNAARVEFYAEVGSGPAPSCAVCDQLRSAADPDEILGILQMRR